MILFEITGDKTGYIRLNEAEIDKSKPISDSLVGDYDENDELIGLEYIDRFHYNDLQILIKGCEVQQEIEDYFNKMNLIIYDEKKYR